MSPPSSVLVVGAGPTGLTAALELARHGLPCRLVDRAPGPSRHSKAIGIQARTLETLALLGLADRFTERGLPVALVSLYGREGEPLATLDLGDLESPFPFVLTLDQSETERLLLEAALARGVAVEWGVELVGVEPTPAGVVARLRHANGFCEDARVGWLLGCDGAHSRVRAAVGLSFAGRTLDLRFVLADVRVETALPLDQAHVALREEGVFALFPLPDCRVRLVADDPPASLVEGDRAPTLEEWQALADRRAVAPMRLRDLSWTSYFRIHSRLVESFRRGPVFLLGDAAHVHSPALAQGMNTGIQDAVNLGWKLARVARGQSPARLLDSYEAERRPVAEGVLRLTELATRFVTSTGSVVSALREQLLPLLAGVDAVQRHARRRVSELDVSYRRSSVVEEVALDGGPHAGDRAPDARLTVAAIGEPTTLLARFAHPGHTLVALSGTDRGRQGLAHALRVATSTAWQYGTEVVPCVVSAHAAEARKVRAADGQMLVVDREGEVAARYGTAGALYLIRPDGYVAFRAPLVEDRALRGFLERYLPGGSSGVQPPRVRA